MRRRLKRCLREWWKFNKRGYMNQQFIVKNLNKFSRKSDDYLIGSIDELTLLDIETSIYDESFEFSNFKIIDKYLNLLDIDIHELLILRKLNHNIKKLYKIKQSDRTSIIKQVKTLLTETSRNIYVTRLDIKNFYSSINKNNLLKKLLENDYLLSYHSKFLLNQLFNEHTQLSTKQGLPFGLNLSATLSELYMRDFDKKIQKIDGVYYFARYVDDIIIFSIKDINIKELIEEKHYLHDELHFNEDKCEFTTITQNNPFELSFLGYKFNYANKILNISIADKKISKIKSRIIYTFIDYFKTNDFNLLDKRIRFLTGNYIIYKNEDRALKGGLSYNYSFINDYTVLKELDKFLIKTIFSKNGSIGKKNCLSNIQKKALKKYSFLFGFQNKVLHKFNKHEHSLIKRCW